MPERYSARAIGGNVIDVRAVEGAGTRIGLSGGVSSIDTASITANVRPPVVGGRVHIALAKDALPGQIRGRVTDAQGGVLPGVTIAFATRTGQMIAITDEGGTFLVSGIPPAR